MPWLQTNTFTVLVTAFLVGCSTPVYVDKSDPNATKTPSLSQVVYEVHDSYRTDPPECVAILPFTAKLSDDGDPVDDITIDQKEAVRRAVYAHLSPQGKRDVELPRINFVLSQMSQANLGDDQLLGEKLRCDAIVRGEVIEYGSTFLIAYSRISVGAKVTMVRASDSALLWEGEHVATTHGGTIPLSPVGLAMGLFDATSNVSEEELLRRIDDLARRLVKTIPDNRIAVLDEPIVRIKQVSAKKPDAIEQPEQPVGVDGFIASIADRPPSEQKQALLKAIGSKEYGEENARKLYAELVSVLPDDPEPQARFANYLMETGDYEGALGAADASLAIKKDGHEMHFLKGRIYIKQGDLNKADDAIVKAVANTDSPSSYLNGIGYVNSLRGNQDRALAAYKMVLDHDPLNGYAYYNSGVTYFNLGDLDNAADHFYGAGLAYIKSGDYGQAEKALEDMKDLAAEGLNVSQEINTLETAIQALSK